MFYLMQIFVVCFLILSVYGDGCGCKRKCDCGNERCAMSTASSWTEYGSHQYFISTKTKTWEDAQSECERYNSHLVKIESKEEDEWLQTVTDVSKSYWTGANDKATEGEWMWTDSSPVTYTGWYWGEPNGNKGRDEDCMSLYWGGHKKWFDNLCSDCNRFICEKE